MKTRHAYTGIRTALMAALAAAAGTAALPAQAQGVVSEWATVQAPPAPPLSDVTVEPAKTALLVMDFGEGNCGREPRCTAVIPNVKALLGKARANKMLVVYSGFPGLQTMADVAPQAGEPMVVGRADKFYNTNLDEILKQHGITTVIACGTAANGAELFTAFGAAVRGYQVIVPVDCMPGRSAYAEQSVVWGMANNPGLAAPAARPPGAPAGGPPAGGPPAGGPPPSAAPAGPPPGHATLTSTDKIHF